MKCPDCKGGVVELFISSVKCTTCDGTGNVEAPAPGVDVSSPWFSPAGFAWGMRTRGGKTARAQEEADRHAFKPERGMFELDHSKAREAMRAHNAKLQAALVNCVGYEVAKKAGANAFVASLDDHRYTIVVKMRLQQSAALRPGFKVAEVPYESAAAILREAGWGLVSRNGVTTLGRVGDAGA